LCFEVGTVSAALELNLQRSAVHIQTGCGQRHEETSLAEQTLELHHQVPDTSFRRIHNQPDELAELFPSRGDHIEAGKILVTGLYVAGVDVAKARAGRHGYFSSFFR
jgi:hypothetical protein